MNTAQLEKQQVSISAQVAARYWQATLQRDARADGAFVFAVRSTHIYCQPSCPARRPLRQNAVFFRTAQEAEKQGYRPCRRCRPKERPELSALVAKAAEALGNSEEEGVRLDVLAAQIGATPTKLRRAFRRMTGLTPKAFAQAARLARFKKLLREGSEITDALYACGYGSPSRVYEKTHTHLGMTPAAYRKGAPGMQIGYTVANSSIGRVLVAATTRGVSAVYLGESQERLVDELHKEYPRAEIRRARETNEPWLQEILHRIEGDAPSVDL